jgi:hypothetical protein
VLYQHILADVQRIADHIPQIVDAEQLSPLAGLVREALISQLGVLGTDARVRCKELLDEAPATAEERRDVTVRRDRLGVARLAIRKFNIK